MCQVLENLRNSKDAAKLGVKSKLPLVCLFEGSCAKDIDACLEIHQTPRLSRRQMRELGHSRVDKFYQRLAVSAALLGILGAGKDQSS
jgi:hypothetical protein